MMTPFEFARLAAACYGIAYIAAYKDGPWMVIDKARTALGAPKCEVCWGPWVAAGLLSSRFLLAPAAFELLVTAAAMSGVVTWLATKPFSATLQSFGMTGFSPAAPSSVTPSPSPVTLVPSEDCPSCEKAKRAREAATKASRETPQPAPAALSREERGHGWRAGVEAEG